MAKPNYQFEKRQRELDKKKKKAEKAQRKANVVDESGQPAGGTTREAASPEQLGG